MQHNSHHSPRLCVLVGSRHTKMADFYIPPVRHNCIGCESIVMFSLWTSGGAMYVRHWKVTTKMGSEHIVTVRHQASTGWRQGLLDHVEMWYVFCDVTRLSPPTIFCFDSLFL